MKRKCEQCGRTIRSNSTKAIPLFLRETRKGLVQVEVCGKKCLTAYNDGEEVDEDA